MKWVAQVYVAPPIFTFLLEYRMNHLPEWTNTKHDYFVFEDDFITYWRDGNVWKYATITGVGHVKKDEVEIIRLLNRIEQLQTLIKGDIV
jgi:hypothetical protein